MELVMYTWADLVSFISLRGYFNLGEIGVNNFSKYSSNFFTEDDKYLKIKKIINEYSVTLCVP